jgi:hypothetical protein
MSRKLWPLAALAMAALIGAGCGSGGGSGSAAANSSTASNQAQAVKFAECMRSNGVPQFPDPDASGQLTIDAVVNGSGIDPNGSAWNGALDACKDLQPSGFTGPAERSPEQQSQGLKFAQCIREHGVPDFPDPTAGQPLVDTNRIPSSNTSRGMSILNAAMHACSDLSPVSAAGQ